MQSTLKVGNNAPTLSVFKWIKGKPVNEWKNGKVYLIEFGATWCAPCAAAIPELSAIQNKYADDVTVISVFVKEKNTEPLSTKSPAYVSHVENYVKKRSDKIGYTVAVDNPQGDVDKHWLNAAGLSGVPHLFVIDKKGMISWIGGSTATAEKQIQMILSDVYDLSTNIQETKRAEEQETKYDPSRLLLIGNNGGNEDDFIFRSILTRYSGKIFANQPESVQSYLWLKPDSIFDKFEDKLEIIGASIGQLYYLAYSDTLSNVVAFPNYNYEYPDTLKNPFRRKSYGKYWHEPILEVKDKRPFEFSWNSSRHRYCYSLKVPKGTGSAKYLQSIFRNDLQNYFGYSVTVETRSMPYWKLSAPDKQQALSKLKSKNQSLKIKVKANESPFIFQNAEMRDMIRLLASTYGYGTLDYGKLPPDEQSAFIDKTSITELIDFTFDRNQSFEQMKVFLKTLGLDLSKDFKPMKVVVIRDSAQTNN
jgi:thiol-disulfide isomerase/thioredoxin